MIQFIKEWSGPVALVILAIMGLSGFVKTNSFGTAIDCGATTCFTTLGALTSFQDDGTAIFNGAVTFAGAVTQSGAALFTGGVYASSTVQTSGPLVVYTTNTATSTTSVGCIQTTATSTATPIRLELGNTTSATTTFRGVNGIGFVVWAFGNCP